MVYLKKHIVFITFLALSISLFSIELEEFYNSFGSSFNGSTDENTGLTTFPILMIPFGGKSEGMGTAFTAVADDVSYINSNPAGSATLSNTELAFQHNNWIADTSIEGFIYTSRKNNWGYGVAGRFLYVPFTEYNDWGEEESSAAYKETLIIFNSSYLLFPSYYFYGVSLGANFKVAYRNIPEVIEPGQSAAGAMLDLGALTRFNFLKFYSSRSKNFSVGVTLKNLGAKALNEPLPTESTVGFAYSPIRPITFSTDINFPMSFDSDREAEKWNMAYGTNIVFTDFYSVQAGFRYRGNNPRFSLGSMINYKDIVFNVNYTLDLTTQAKAFDRFSIEAKLNLGDKGRLLTRTKTDELYALGLEAYAKGHLIDSIEFFEQALELDPNFQPAKENLQIAQRSIELQRLMRELQTVE